MTEPGPVPIRDAAHDERWRRVLTGEDRGMREFRAVLRHVPSSPRCKQCNGPFAGMGGVLMRAVGKAPWVKNPHFCAQCFRFLERDFGGAEIEVSLMFADVRGSTSLAERIGPMAFTDVLNRFYRAAVEIVIDRDGLVDKFVGDEVVAIFAPGWAGPGHARRAIEAAEGLLRATGHGPGLEPWLPVGAGVHTGVAYVGTVGLVGQVTDFTALGDPVNAAARLASAARAGEILISADTLAAAAIDPAGIDPTSQELRGRAEAMVAYAVDVDAAARLLSGVSAAGAPAPR